MITKKPEIVDESKVEEVFNTALFEKYSIVEFSLEETYRIFDLIKDGLDKCQEIDYDLFTDINHFKYIYNVYDFQYKTLDSD